MEQSIFRTRIVGPLILVASGLMAASLSLTAQAQLGTLPGSKITPKPIVKSDLTLRPRVVSVTMEEHSMEPPPAAGTTRIRSRTGTVKLEGLPAGGKVRLYSRFEYPDASGKAFLLGSPALDSGVYCSAIFAPRNGAPFVEAIVNAKGEAVLDVSASLSIRTGGSEVSDADGPCQGYLGLEYTATGAKPQYSQPRTTTFGLPAFPKYTYSQTAALSKFFKFQMNADPGSTCSGTSIGPRNYKVGVVTVGGDLAITVRSGPAGTTCRTVSPGIAVPKGVSITKIDWDVVKSAPSGQRSKCCAGDECLSRVGESVVIAPGHLPDDIPDTYQGGGFGPQISRTFRVTQPSTSATTKLLGYAHGWLACDPTAVNDHGVTLILKSIEMEAPTGYPMPR